MAGGVLRYLGLSQRSRERSPTRAPKRTPSNYWLRHPNRM